MLHILPVIWYKKSHRFYDGAVEASPYIPPTGVQMGAC